jgi:hypothetical protein
MEALKCHIKGYYQFINNNYVFINKDDKKIKNDCLKNNTLHYYDGYSFSKVYR